MDVNQIDRYNFRSEWVRNFPVYSSRSVEAIDVIYNAYDRPSGFTYVINFFAA